MRTLVRTAAIACTWVLGLAVVWAVATPGAGSSTLVGGWWPGAEDGMCCYYDTPEPCTEGQAKSGGDPVGCKHTGYIDTCTTGGGINKVEVQDTTPCYVDIWEPLVCQNTFDCECKFDGEDCQP